ncbi:hypothetical protein GE118_02860 [Mycoplasma sp. NEAQ87857]|uniref:transglutaminase domain-containing protein n=1 Tax=Mycoplasma sp. NEAQ87857 TaxID=2683967 RepID=UPI0013181A77|nr:transglutaminase domain-containing protein [Mycoplasma sp. NEAQ87857]QGZ97730.1 hypothetical protein GE118_02860 [Mycoplasma sp. NEAQ87857]
MSDTNHNIKNKILLFKSKKFWIPLIATLTTSAVVIPTTIFVVKNNKKQQLQNNIKEIASRYDDLLHIPEFKNMQDLVLNSLNEGDVNTASIKLDQLQSKIDKLIDQKQKYSNKINNDRITKWLSKPNVKQMYIKINNQLEHNNLNNVEKQFNELEKVVVSYNESKNKLTKEFKLLTSSYQEWFNKPEIYKIYNEVSNDLNVNNLDQATIKLNELKQTLESKINKKEQYQNKINNIIASDKVIYQKFNNLYQEVIKKLDNNDLDGIEEQINKIEELVLNNKQIKAQLEREFNLLNEDPAEPYNAEIVRLKALIRKNLKAYNIDRVKVELEELKIEIQKEKEKSELNKLMNDLAWKINEYRQLDFSKITNINESNAFKNNEWSVNVYDNKSEVVSKIDDINNWITKYNQLLIKQDQFDNLVSNFEATKYNQNIIRAKIFQFKNKDLTLDTDINQYINELKQLNSETYSDKLSKVKRLIQKENGYLDEAHWQEFKEIKLNNPDFDYGIDLTPYDVSVNGEKTRLMNVGLPLEQRVKWEYYIFELNKIKDYFNQNGELFWQINKRIDFFIKLVKKIFKCWSDSYHSASNDKYKEYNYIDLGDAKSYLNDKDDNYIYSLEEVEMLFPKVFEEISKIFKNHGIWLRGSEPRRPMKEKYFNSHWFYFDYDLNKTIIGPEEDNARYDFYKSSDYDDSYKSTYFNFEYLTSWIKYYTSPEVKSMVIDMNNSIGEINDNDVIALNDYKKYEVSNPSIAKYLKDRTNFIFEEGGDFYNEPNEFDLFRDYHGGKIRDKYFESYYKDFILNNKDYFNTLNKDIRFSYGDILTKEAAWSGAISREYYDYFPFSQWVYWNESDYKKYVKYVDIDSKYRLNENKSIIVEYDENILANLLFTQPNYFASSGSYNPAGEHLKSEIINKMKTADEYNKWVTDNPLLWYNPIKEFNEWYKKWKEVLPKIIDKNWTDEQKVKAVMFYICANSYYYSNDSSLSFKFGSFFANGKRPSNPTILFDENIRSLKCVGYSKNLSMALTLLNIPVRIMGGVSKKGMIDGAHAWNEVFLDGRWKVIDLTNSDFSEELYKNSDNYSRVGKIDPAYKGFPTYEMNPNRMIFERNDDYTIANYKLTIDSYILTITNYSNPDEYEYPYLPRSIYANGPSWTNIDFNKELPFIPEIISNKENEEYEELHKNDPIDNDYDSALNWKRPKNYLG